MLRLTVWMDAPSFYQDDFFKALAASDEVDLQVIFARGLPIHRMQIGWKESQQRNYRCLTLEAKYSFGKALRAAWLQKDRVHVVNGIWAEPAFAAALCVLGLTRATFAIYAEAPDPGKTRSCIKRLARHAFGAFVAKRAKGLLAVSRLAAVYFTKLGFHPERVYPFGYFRANHSSQNGVECQAKKGRTEIIFIGQIIRRKGLDILLKAMQPLFAKYQSLHLTIIGTGDDRQALQALVRSAGFEERVVFEGVIPPDQIQARLATADLLVLPSRWDGWGLVVNEAFSVGVPVIVSDRCGASDLVQGGTNGYVFHAEDIDNLRECLDSFLSRRTDWARFKANARAMGNRISIEAVAPYFVDCLKHMEGSLGTRPKPPWL